MEARLLWEQEVLGSTPRYPTLPGSGVGFHPWPHKPSDSRSIRDPGIFHVRLIAVVEGWSPIPG